MLVSDFDFELPEDLIAQTPMEPRDASRLLVYDRKTRDLSHSVFSDLPRFLEVGDLLVLNDTAVLPCRLIGRRSTGGSVEALILERRGGDCRGYVKPARKIRPGEHIELEDGRLILVAGAAGPDGMMDFTLRLPLGAVAEDVGSCLEDVGRAPLPPYIRRSGEEDPSPDRRRYQTVFASVPGAVAAPTAGLHFTPELLQTLRAGGIRDAAVTLHVGPGTFAPVRVDELSQHRMHAEWYELSPAVADEVSQARARGGRVVAVGTTAARTLETCGTEGAGVSAGQGTTDVFLHPGRRIRVVDALITNFHLPRSTLLMLVAALVGREEILRVYAEAVERRYRFYSYGDAMLIL